MGNFGIKIDLLKLKNSFVTNLKARLPRNAAWLSLSTTAEFTSARKGCI